MSWRDLFPSNVGQI